VEVQRGEDYLRLSADVQQRLNELVENAGTDDQKRRLFEELCVELDKHLFRAESERD
jgi:hypothetical protein